MRKLSVKRKWSIIECASKIYLYVQCPEEYATHNIDGKNFREYRDRKSTRLNSSHS